MTAASRVRKLAARASAHPQSEGAARLRARRHGRGDVAATVGVHDVGAMGRSLSAVHTDTAHSTGDASAS